MEHLSKTDLVKVDAVKIRLLKELDKNGQQPKTELTRTVRHYTKEQRNTAFDQLEKSKAVELTKSLSIKPGPNPVHLKITEQGQQELAALKLKHGIGD